jgi:hypothetical protein
MFYRSLSVLLSFFFWTLWCLSFFDLRIMLTPLVSSNSSWHQYKSVNMLYIADNIIELSVSMVLSGVNWSSSFKTIFSVCNLIKIISRTCSLFSMGCFAVAARKRYMEILFVFLIILHTVIYYIFIWYYASYFFSDPKEE